MVLVLAFAFVVRVYFSQGRLLGMDIINQSEFVNNLIHFNGFPESRLYMAPGSSFSYPPLALLLEGLFASLFNVKVVYVAVWAAIVASACLAPVTYLLGIEVLNSRAGALLGSLFLGFSYLDLEFLGWSAFPSILGVLLSSIVIYFVLRYLRTMKLSDLLGYTLALGALSLTHVYSTLITLVVLGFIVLATRRFHLITGIAFGLSLGLPWYAWGFNSVFSSLVSALSASHDYQQVSFFHTVQFANLYGELYFVLFGLAIGYIVLSPLLVRKSIHPNRVTPVAVWLSITLTLGGLGGSSFLLSKFLLEYRALFYTSAPLSVFAAGGFSSILLTLRASFARLPRKTVGKFCGTLMGTLLILLVVVILAANLLPIHEVYSYESVAQQEEINALNFISANATGVYCSDWYFGQWIAGYSSQPTLVAYPANVYYTNPVEYHDAKIAESVLSKSSNWTELALENGISYIGIDTRLSYIDAYIPQSPTFSYYNTAKFVNTSSVGSATLRNWNWSAPTQGSSFQVGNSGIAFGSNATRPDTWYALSASPIWLNSPEYVYASGSVPQIGAGVLGPVMIVYYDPSYTNFTEVQLPVGPSFSVLAPITGRPYQIRFAVYSQTTLQNFSMNVTGLTLYDSIHEVDFTPLHLIYSSQNIYIFEFDEKQPTQAAYPRLQPPVYPLYFYLPAQIGWASVLCLGEKSLWLRCNRKGAFSQRHTGLCDEVSGRNLGAQQRLVRQDEISRFDFVSWQLVRNYFRMFTFALSRARFDNNPFRALLFLLNGLFAYFVFPMRMLPTQFGFFVVKSRANVRSTTYDCFKTHFTYLHNLKRLCVERSAPMSLVVDVGANVGDFSMGIRKYAKKVIAIEPSSEFADLLKLNLSANEVHNVSLLRLALHDKDESVHLNGQGSNIYVQAEGNGNEIVPGRTLDGILDGVSSVDIVKIDSQGSELRILSGMRDMLTEKRISLIVVEVHEKLGITIEEVVKFMRSVGYQCVLVDSYLFDQPHLYFQPGQY